MRTRLLPGLLAVTAALSTLVAAGPAQAAASPKPGFTIRGLGRVATGTGADGALVIDGAGRKHVLAVDIVGGRARYTYQVRGGGRASRTQTQRLPAFGIKPRVFETLSADGAHVYAAVAACNGIWTAAARVKKNRLSRFRRALPGTKSCSAARYRAMLTAVVPLPGGRLALLASPAYGAGSTPPLGAAFTQVYVGKPGHRFQLASSQPQQVYDGSLAGSSVLALDATTGRLVFARLVEDLAGQQTVHVQVGGPDTGWSSPVVAATVPTAYSDLAVTAAAGQVAIAVSRHADSVTPVNASPLPGILLIEGTEAGGWQPPAAAPYTDNADVQPQLGLAADGRLSLAFGRCADKPRRNRAPGVVYTEVRNEGGVWSQPRARSAKQRIAVEWVLPGRQRVGFRTFAANAPGKYHGACA
jgi:hypothetical protein